MQIVFFLLCTIPFWTSNVIRMISWIPLLGRNGLVNTTLLDLGLVEKPVEWMLYSEFSVILAFVHLYSLFMVVPIFNSMMRIDHSLLEAAHDAGELADSISAAGQQLMTAASCRLLHPHATFQHLQNSRRPDGAFSRFPPQAMVPAFPFRLFHWTKRTSGSPC